MGPCREPRGSHVIGWLPRCPANKPPQPAHVPWDGSLVVLY